MYIPPKNGNFRASYSQKGEELLTGHASLEANLDEHNYLEFEKISVNAVTLSSLVIENNIKQIDFLSIDVEGAELDVLMGADLQKTKPTLILLEDKHLYLVKHRYLVRQGYVLVQRHNRNCWYIRSGAPLPKVGFKNQLKLWKRMYISIWVKKISYAIRHKTISPFLVL